MWKSIVVTRVMETLQYSQAMVGSHSSKYSPWALLPMCFGQLSNYYILFYLMVLWCALVFSSSILDDCNG